MDKNTYESYEFLPINNDQEVAEQYFVIQDDGTLLNQLVSNEGATNLYNGSFLLQPGPSTSPQQVESSIEESVVDYVKDDTQEICINTETPNSKDTNVFTEITLSDEQYNLLEQKGWILLESNDKIFVLDTLGLHDITDNDKLIQKLKNEMESSNDIETSLSFPKTEDQSNPMSILHCLPAEGNGELINDDNSATETIENVENMCLIIDKEEQEVEDQIESSGNSFVAICSDDEKNNANVAEVKSLKIKTKFSFKDIPDKIFLGKTTNGKNLYAKVKSCSKPIVVYEINADNQVDHLVHDPDMSREQFLSLVYNLNGKIVDKKQYEENIIAAKSAVAEISKIPKLKRYIIDKYLFITRITHKIDNINNKHYKGKPSLLTAVVAVNSNGYWELMPNHNILDDILKDIIPEELSNNEYWKTHVSHIHIKEVKSINNIIRVYLTVGEQELCFLALSEKPRRRSPLHACSSCAKVFNSEQELEYHQESQCLDPDDPLTNDMTEPPSVPSVPYTKIQNGDEELYSCLQCDAKFFRLSGCEKHIQTHYIPKSQKMEVDSSKSGQQPNNETEQSDANKKIYKCSMCPGTYLHSSTFSKHLISQHIKLQLN